MNRIKLAAVVAAVCALAALGAGKAQAQGAPSTSAFISPTFAYDIFASRSSDGMTYTFSLGANPYFKFGGNTYNVRDVFGVFVLDTVPPPGFTNADGLDYGEWKFAPKNNPDDVVGWVDNDKKDTIKAKGSKSFAFTTLDINSPTAYGFHVRLTENQKFPGTDGDTGYIKLGDGKTPIVRVPEPAYYQMAALLMLGGLGILRYRKNREQFR